MRKGEFKGEGQKQKDEWHYILNSTFLKRDILKNLYAPCNITAKHIKTKSY